MKPVTYGWGARGAVACRCHRRVQQLLARGAGRYRRQCRMYVGCTPTAGVVQTNGGQVSRPAPFASQRFFGQSAGVYLTRL